MKFFIHTIAFCLILWSAIQMAKAVKENHRYNLEVEGWNHGSVICRAKSVTIEIGYENDPQVQELLKLRCPSKE